MSYKVYQRILSTLIVALTITGTYFACGAGGPTGGYVTSMTVDGSGGLVQTGTTGVVSAVGIRKDCTSGQAVTWSGTAWVCTTIAGGGLSTVTADSPLAGLGTSGSHLTWSPTLGNLQGTGSSGSPLRTNLTTTTCAAGSAESATAADGTSTCIAVVTSVTGPSGNGVGVSAASGGPIAFRLTGLSGIDCGANQLLEDVSGAQDWRCVNFPTAGTGTVTSITPGTGLSASPSSPITTSGTLNVNLTTTTCSAGSAETATAANGTSTCSAVVNSITGTAPIVSSLSAGVDTLSLSLTPTACAAGKAETATSALGVGTCNFFFNTAGTNLTSSSNTVSVVASPSFAGSVTAATGITSSGGNITAAAGSVSAGTTLTSGTDTISGRDVSSARWFVTTGAAPTISSCGVGATVAANATDVGGHVIVGSSTSSCTLNWGIIHSQSPVNCVVSAQVTGVTDLWATQNTFGMVIHGTGTFGGGTAVVGWHCDN